MSRRLFFATAEWKFAEDSKDPSLKHRSGLFTHTGMSLVAANLFAVGLSSLTPLSDEGASDSCCHFLDGSRMGFCSYMSEELRSLSATASRHFLSISSLWVVGSGSTCLRQKSRESFSETSKTSTCRSSNRRTRVAGGEAGEEEREDPELAETSVLVRIIRSSSTSSEGEKSRRRKRGGATQEKGEGLIHLLHQFHVAELLN